MKIKNINQIRKKILKYKEHNKSKKTFQQIKR